MQEVSTIKEFIDTIAPPELCETWDNSGLLINANEKATTVLVTLDITNEVVQEAKDLKCDLIVSHHPVIFHAFKALKSMDVVYKLAQSDISAICVHTNLDAAPNGVNDVLANVLGLKNIVAIPPFGRLGELETEMSGKEFSKHCSKCLSTGVYLADADKLIKKVAVIGGQGSDFIEEAIAAGADCLVTGEAGHHDAIDAVAEGISLIFAGHYATEWPVIPVLAQTISNKFPDLKVYVSNQKQPFELVF